MNKKINPRDVHKPLGAYSHTVKVPAGATWVAIAGQVGMDAKGKLGGTFKAQAELAFRNLVAGVRAQGMRKSDLVKITVFITDGRQVDAYRAARKKVLGDKVTPASTLLVVQGLASPDMMIEVEGWAAK